MKIYHTTHSLKVLAGMLEAGTIDGVVFAIHGVNEGDSGHCARHLFTPEQLRSMDRNRHKMASVSWVRYERTEKTYATIGHGLKHVV